jgi:hypothetical protein
MEKSLWQEFDRILRRRLAVVGMMLVLAASSPTAIAVAVADIITPAKMAAAKA